MTKSLNYKRLMAIDPSLTCSGWALFSVQSEKLLAVGKIRSLPSSVALAKRVSDLQEKINRVLADLKLNEEDALVCEAPTTMRDPAAALKVEQVRGLFEGLARSRRLLVPGRINPRSVQREVMGLRGRQQARTLVKEAAQRVVLTCYAQDLEALGFPLKTEALGRHQDIVDAILVGNLALVRLKSAQRSGAPLFDMFQDSSRRYKSRRVRLGAEAG